MAVNLSENVLYSCMKENSRKPLETLKADANFWLAQVRPEHFSRLNTDIQKQVKLVKTINEF